jgi:lipopolysaccharide/colanic/teichoic acid biosynthesis glycosyltransferase
MVVGLLFLMKRLFDLTVAALLLLLLLPILALIGLLVIVSSGRPVFFRQVRVGQWGHDFRIVKFRTMRVRREAELGIFSPGNTVEVTGAGRILRKTKLDELPQLWNVVRGEMSLVGPRPEVRRWVNAYPERWAKVLCVRPGITDPASIEFRHEEEILAASAFPEQSYCNEILPRKLDLYENYVTHRTFRGDVTTLFKTVWIVLARPGNTRT